MLIEPQTKGVLYHAGNEARGLPGRQPLFGLTAELRVENLRRQNEAAALPNIIWGQFQAAGQQIAELAKLAQRLEQASAQALRRECRPAPWE
jgi:hypothetical protein